MREIPFVMTRCTAFSISAEVPLFREDCKNSPMVCEELNDLGTECIDSSPFAVRTACEQTISSGSFRHSEKSI